MSVKLNEGLEHMKSAEKSLKTSFLKWRPDYDSAANEYSQAAQCFRIAHALEKTKECHLLASKCYKENKSYFHAAKSLEQALLAVKEVSTPDDIYQMAQQACNLYQQHGSIDSGAGVLDKGAKILEEKNPEHALKLYQHAADIVSGESTGHQAIEYLSKSARILVKLQKFDQAADALRREIGYHQSLEAYGPMGRLIVAIVLIQLARGDCVAAEKAYKEWGNCCEAPEAAVVEQLLQAFDEEDADAARAALANPFIRHMDVEYSRLARTIPLPKDIVIKPKAKVIENAAASYVSTSDKKLAGASNVETLESGNNIEEEEGGGGLC